MADRRRGHIGRKEAANVVDVDSNPIQLVEVGTIGTQLPITRGAITTCSDGLIVQ